MEYCLSVNPEEKLKKEIDRLRYHYDRKLIKERYPYINIFGPIEDYTNFKRLSLLCSDSIGNRKRFRISTDIVSFLEYENIIFLNIFHKGEMKEIFSKILDKINIPLDINFFPHIILSKNHNKQETEYIYEDLKKTKFKFSFLCKEITLLIKKEKYWEKSKIFEF